MAKEDLIKQIQELVFSNNQKAITGDSLGNLLIDIVTELSGNSGGGGYIKVWMNELIAEVPLTTEQREENVATYQKLISKGHYPVIACAEDEAFGMKSTASVEAMVSNADDGELYVLLILITINGVDMEATSVVYRLYPNGDVTFLD